MKKISVLLMLILFISVNSFAYTYGYMILRDKKANSIEQNLKMLALHVKSLPNGEILFVDKIKKGMLFFKKYAYTVIFKGPATQIRDLLKRSPWEGDILKDIFIKIEISTFSNDDSKKNFPMRTDISKEFSNPIKAISYIKNSTESKIMRAFAQKDNKAYKAHVKFGTTREIVFTIYSTRPSEANKLFSIQLKK